MKQNIKHIVDHALCTACGACAALCPTHAIGMAQNAAGYLCAVIDDHQCQNCGICDHVCPSNGREKLPMVKGSDIFHGKCLEGYMGYAADENIRQESQSGGVVTALLCYLLEKNIIGGAVVNQFDGETRRPKAVFATSGEEIITGCGSYYAQSPVIETALRHAQQKDTAAVVLGCQ
ncbi:MAG: coenzyme F420 hydrogenase/dehydrogenase beta subunit N-terminal domain-containing protein, partial [Dethiobacteria bacterium]